jgi:hypothetical protein
VNGSFFRNIPRIFTRLSLPASVSNYVMTMTTYMNHIYPRTNDDQNYRVAYAHNQCIHLIDAGLYSEQGEEYGFFLQ